MGWQKVRAKRKTHWEYNGAPYTQKNVYKVKGEMAWLKREHCTHAAFAYVAYNIIQILFIYKTTTFKIIFHSSYTKLCDSKRLIQATLLPAKRMKKSSNWFLKQLNFSAEFEKSR